VADLIELARADADLKAAVEDLAGRLDGRALGYKLRSFKRRLFGGWFLDHAAAGGSGVRWAAFPADQFRSAVAGPAAGRGDGGDRGDSQVRSESPDEFRALW
jgi:hypothetical protein